MPNARISNTSINARVGFNGPNARVSSFQGGIAVPAVPVPLLPGMPIGLLLALTYATDESYETMPEFRGDMRPNVRLTTT